MTLSAISSLVFSLPIHGIYQILYYSDCTALDVTIGCDRLYIKGPFCHLHDKDNLNIRVLLISGSIMLVHSE